MKTAVYDIVDYGEIQERTDKRTREERRRVAFGSIDKFSSFAKNCIAEMSPELNKLVLEKMPAAMERNMKNKDDYWSKVKLGNDLALQGIFSEKLSESTKIEGMDDKITELRDKIYDEVWRISNQ